MQLLTQLDLLGNDFLVVTRAGNTRISSTTSKKLGEKSVSLQLWVLPGVGLALLRQPGRLGLKEMLQSCFRSPWPSSSIQNGITRSEMQLSFASADLQQLLFQPWVPGELWGFTSILMCQSDIPVLSLS